MKQYSKRIAVTHWLVFALVVAALFLGHQVHQLENSTEKLSMLPLHFLVGDAILLLTLLRIFFRKRDGEPAPANANPLLDKLTHVVHVGMNLTLVAIAFTGIATVAQSGVVEALKANNPALIPDFSKVEAKEFHELFIAIAVGLIVIHFLAALYHQFIVKDGLLRRIMIRRFMD